MASATTAISGATKRRTAHSGATKDKESQTGAVYVQGLSKHPVDSYEMIAAKMDEGRDQPKTDAMERSETR